MNGHVLTGQFFDEIPAQRIDDRAHRSCRHGAAGKGDLALKLGLE